jgi:hypothetical protein
MLILAFLAVVVCVFIGAAFEEARTRSRTNRLRYR